MLETERLLLRPFCVDDAADLLEYCKEPTTPCFAFLRTEALDAAKEAARERSKDAELYFAIVCKDTGKVIGEINAYATSATPGEGGAKDTFSPCWMLNPAYQGHGYAYEAARAFFDYLFFEKGARRIYAYVEDYNHASSRLCKKLGMRREGCFVEYVSFCSGEEGTPRYDNTEQYAILRHEWEAQQNVKAPFKVYGSRICIDCRNYLAIRRRRGLDIAYLDITENTANLREFLEIRDSAPAFDAVRQRGGIGIPLFVHDDGRMTFDWDEAFSWIGQPPVREEEIVEIRD